MIFYLDKIRPSANFISGVNKALSNFEYLLYSESFVMVGVSCNLRFKGAHFISQVSYLSLHFFVLFKVAEHVFISVDSLIKLELLVVLYGHTCDLVISYSI